jgi:DNA polymerase III epsilon subunit-like protein
MGERIEIKFEFDDSTKTTGKYLVFDAETTGFPINRHASPDDFKNWPYIVQIAWILFDDEQKLIEHNDFYLKQPIKIPADATNIHGITTAMMLEKGIEPSIVYANFKKAIDNTEYIIAHNIDFDIPVVHCEFLRNGLKWDFPNNRLLCTMKTGTNFCKIPPHRNGEYKWPKLTELYQNCFYPGHSMNIFPDATSTKNVHSANIDTCMTAQCFFKLKDLGLFKEFKSETTANSVSAKQTEDNFESLHQRLETWLSDNGNWQYDKIRHAGLGVTRVVRDDGVILVGTWSNSVKAQFKKWDEQWAKIIHKNKSQAEKEAN